MAVNYYLYSVHANMDGRMSETNCRYQRIVSQRIGIAANRLLYSEHQYRFQDMLGHIAYDKEYFMSERKSGIRYWLFFWLYNFYIIHKQTNDE